MTTLIVGASAGVGRALARALAVRAHRLTLVARDRRDLDAEAANLRHSFGATVECIAADAASPESLLQALGVRLSHGEPIRNLFLPLGISRTDDDGTLAPADTAPLLNVNLESVMAVVNTCLPTMMAAGAGNIVGFGSIAAIRGRRTNIVYSVAKRGLESYFESLRHRTAASGVRTQFYRLGYVATQQSFGKKLLLPMARPEWIAEQVVRHLDQDRGLHHLPAFWGIAGALLPLLPWSIYRRLEF